MKPMRLTAGLLIVVSTGVLSQALAADPTPPSHSASQTAPTPAEQPSETAPAAQQSARAPAVEHSPAAPAGEQHAVSAATPKAGSTEVTREDQEILARGYKL